MLFAEDEGRELGQIVAMEDSGIYADGRLAAVPEEETAVSAVLPAQAAERITKKPFGIHIGDPQASPVQPERFRGYHTGADFETFPDEADMDVPVRAICTGELLVKRMVSGYGGVAVQGCTLDAQAVTVVYGHLRLSSIGASVGDALQAGDTLGVLGTGYSEETDGERKHLHLGIHRGTAVDILGYVDSEQALGQWIDPCRFVCGNGNP
jgi:murein DD-endopeptidase MepM/ murein hydrolase activator NlpD